MRSGVIIDAGPLLALLAGTKHSDWATEQWRFIRPPVLTCESVLSEAAFLLRREGCDVDPLFEFIATGVIRIAISVPEQVSDLRVLMQRYKNLPMSLADACLVRLAELNPSSAIFTFDTDFRIYRKHGNKVIPVLMPE